MCLAGTSTAIPDADTGYHAGYGRMAVVPESGREGGFHVGFRKGTGKSGRTLDLILACPHCGYRFAVGDFHIPSGDPRLFDPSIDSGP